MSQNYQFSSLIGKAYNKGNVVFSDHNLLSPVSNRISIFDLANNRLETLPCSSTYNIVCMDVSPDHSMLLMVDEGGLAQFINLQTRTCVHYFDFKRPIRCVSFSPDNRRFAVCIDSSVVLYKCPGRQPEINPFVVDKRFSPMHHFTTCIDWSCDSKVIVVGSQDQNCHVIGCEMFLNLQSHSLCGLHDSVIGCFILKDSLDVIGLSELGELNVWSCDNGLKDLKRGKRKDVAEKLAADNDDDDEAGSWGKKKRKTMKKLKEKKEKEELPDCVKYKRTSKFSYRQLLNNDNKQENNENKEIIRMTSCHYHKQKQLIVTSFQNGAFYLHEMPTFTLIHSLSISEQAISTIRFDQSGDWIALGVSSLGQLLVWEWHSQCYVLKQQGHTGVANCLDHSKDGKYIATGGEDGKVKLWEGSSGQCFVTFDQHTSSVTGIKFLANNKALVTSSLDGTVRAFDMIRYRNYRVLTAPDRTSTQFSCVGVDGEGMVVVAGGHDVFDVFVWSLKNGQLISVLSGHEGPISSVQFSSFEGLLASASWDHTLRLWSIFQSNDTRQVVQLSCDALSLCFRPDGQEIAVATLDCNVVFYDVTTLQQTHCVEGSADLGYSRNKTDKITGKKKSRAFRSITYTADGEFLLAAGDGGVVCLYHVSQEILFRKFQISCNLSLDGTQEFLDRRKMTEWGNIELVDVDDVNNDKNKVSLPGVRIGEHSSRFFRPEVRVTCLSLCPTGLSWSAGTTEGVMTFTLDHHHHHHHFDPYDLDLHVTPSAIMAAIKQARWREAVMMALKLNQVDLVCQVLKAVCRGGLKDDDEGSDDDDDGDYRKMDNTSMNDMSGATKMMTFLASDMSVDYIVKLLGIVARIVEKDVHVGVMMVAVEALMVVGTMRMRLVGGQSRMQLQAALRALQKSLNKIDAVLTVNEKAIYNCRVLQHRRAREVVDSGIEGVGSDALFSDHEDDLS